MNSGCTYIMSNKRRNVFYTGVTSDLTARVIQHRSRQGSKFTSKYNCFYLVYYEYHSSIVDAIDREKQLKNWRRLWKIDLIKTENPNMDDLSESIGVGPNDHLDSY